MILLTKMVSVVLKLSRMEKIQMTKADLGFRFFSTQTAMIGVKNGVCLSLLPKGRRMHHSIVTC